MIEYIFVGILATGLILMYTVINHPALFGKIFSKIPSRNFKRNRYEIYMECFRENKRGNITSNIIVQVLPWLGVLALVYILSSQYFVFATVLSGSMEPTFKKGDMVLMQEFDLNVKVGDIVMFPMYGFKEPITHRVVGITGRGYIITKGDANALTDSTGFPPERIIGKAVLIGNTPIVLKGIGYYTRPQNIGEMRVLTKLPATFVGAEFFEQFRALQPLILFFGTIFYFFILIESRMEHDIRSKRMNGRNNGGTRSR